MDPALRQSMLDYYNERAPEYEEVYTIGKGSASIPDPNIFKMEAKALTSIVGDFAQGDFIDIACGTGYWLPHYAHRCSTITFFDQSERMLSQCKEKVDHLQIADRCSVLQGDFFNSTFPKKAYDRAFVGFFLSHLTETQEGHFFQTLREILRPSGEFLIFDSAWSEQRAKFNTKIERQERQLNDGTKFLIYKKYCDRNDISSWPEKYKATVSLRYFGTAFFAVSGTVD